MKVSRTCILDIESNGLLSHMVDYSSFPYKLNKEAKLWVVCIIDSETGTIIKETRSNITKEWLEKTLAPYDKIVGHNILKFDLPALRLFGVLDYSIGSIGEGDKLFGRDVEFIDTIIMARLLDPALLGGHSLDAWGKRVGEFKTDFRQVCIDKNYMLPTDAKGFEFSFFSQEMVDYCDQDVIVGNNLYKYLKAEMDEHPHWGLAMKLEHKLADISVSRENIGFWFDKELALECLEDLTNKMEELREIVNPLLPLKPLGKTELKKYTPPATQFLKSGKPSSHIIKFAERNNGTVENHGEEYYLKIDSETFKLPFNGAIKTHTKADIKDLDLVKTHLVSLGWEPTEWAERDLTKDSKKQYLTFEKRKAALDKWFVDTMEGKYTKHRLEDLKGDTDAEIYADLIRRLQEDWPVRVRTSPKVRVGVEKNLCENLEALGEKVSFAKDFAMFLTYKHRKSSIAGGDTEDMDFGEESPEKGYLSMYREVDGRIPTPAIEIGANTGRYRHIGVCNIPRATSIYGKEMRSLFGAGKGFIQFGFDFASLEARIQSHYCWNYTDGKELSKALLAEKPNDLHTKTAEKIGISRNDAKSINYMLMYGGSYIKAMSMLNINAEEAKDIVKKFWDSVPSLKEFKEQLEKEWRSNGEKWVMGLDGRKLNVRSRHSLVNLIFQSGGVIAAKFVTVLLVKKMEANNLNTNPFKGVPDVTSMIDYHDECQLVTLPKYLKFKTFSTEEEAKDFVSKWEGAQLSDISHGKTWYVALPSLISKAVEESISETEGILGLNINLGYAYSVANNWYGCH